MKYDFGSGPVPAHKHVNGGGWVADTASVEEGCFIGYDAKVYDHGKVYGHGQVCGHGQVYG